MHDEIRIIEFDPKYQNDAANLINTGLGDRFGFVDENMNPDLFDINSSYLDGVFLIALDGELLVATGALLPVTAEEGQIVRMHTHSKFRRFGIATRVLNALEDYAIQQGIDSLFLETNLDWGDAILFYQRNGFLEFARNEVGIRFRKTL